MSKTNNKFRIIDASTNPNIDSSIWLNCGVESLIIDSERGGIYKGNGTTLPTEIISKKNIESEFNKIFDVINLPSPNEIWYTTNDDNIVNPYNADAFDVTIISNEYKNGRGVITFDAPLVSIGYEAFRDCTSLTSVIIPNSVTSIGGYAFRSCTSLTSVTIPDSMKEIGEWAFYNCTALTSVTIPDSVTSIGKNVFYKCPSLKSVTIGNGVTSIGNYAFGDCTSLTSVTIPDSVTSIGGSAFSGCSSLTSIAIPNSITSIESYAFYNCTSLKSVTIGNSVTEIKYDAFRSCKSLTSVTIPDSVTSIGEQAFYNCSSLTSVTIGNSVTSIGQEAFYRCTSLKEVYCKPTTPPTIQNNTLDFNIETIYVTSESVDTYKSATNWSKYGDRMVGSPLFISYMNNSLDKSDIYKMLFTIEQLINIEK